MEGVWAVGCDSGVHATTDTTAVYTCNSLLCTLDTQSNTVTPQIVDPDAPVFALAASTQRRVYAYVLEQPDPVITVRSATTNEVLAVLEREGEDALPCALAFDASGSLLYAMDAPPHRSLVLWNWADQSIVARAEVDDPGHFHLRVNPQLWTQCLVYSKEHACVWEVEIVRDASVVTPRAVNLSLTTKERQGSRFLRRTSLEESLNLQMVFEEETTLTITDAFFSDETSVVCGCADGELIEADFDTGATHVVVTSSKFGAGAFDALHWHGDSSTLIAAGRDGVLRWFLWTEAAPTLMHTLTTNLTTATIASVGRVLAIAGPEHVSVVANHQLITTSNGDDDDDSGEGGATSNVTATEPTVNTIVQGAASPSTAVFTSVVPSSSSSSSSSSSHADDDQQQHEERVVTVTASELVHQHTTGGAFVGSASIASVDAATTAVACASCSPALITGSSKGCLQAFRLLPSGGCERVCKRLVHGQRVNAVAVDETGTTVVSASKRHFVVLAMPSLEVRCAGEVEHDILNVRVSFHQGRTVIVVLLQHPDAYTRALTFAVPEDQSVLADNFFSDTLLKIDFNKAPINVTRLPQNVDKVLLAERVLLCWDIRSGSFYACASPSLRPSHGDTPPFAERVDNAPELEVLESFRGIFGRSSSAALSVAGHFATACSSTGQIVTIPLTPPGRIGSPLTVSVTRTRALTTTTPVSHVAWTRDASKLVVASTTGSLAALEFSSDTEWRGKMLGIAKQATQFISVQLMDSASEATKRLMQAQADPLPAIAEQQQRGSIGTGAGMTAVEEAVQAAHDRALQEATSGDGDMQAEITALREKLEALVAANSAAVPEEQLDKDEFVLDLEQKARLQTSLDEAVNARRADIQTEILKEQFHRNNIKRECWDAMAVPGKRIYGFDIKLEVMNFPLRKLSEAEKNAFDRIVSIRRTEIAVENAIEKLNKQDEAPATPMTPMTPLTPLTGDGAAAVKSSSGDGDGGEGDGDGDNKADSGGGGDGSGGQGDKGKNGGDGGGDEDTEDAAENVRPLLYHPLNLQTAPRKRMQIVLLERYVRQLKKAFNVTFEEFLELKREEAQKIGAKNEEIKKICRELNKRPTLYTPKKHTLEHPEDLLTVRDDEITVERVLTAEERRKKEEEDRLEAERRAAAANDNARERGVHDMMYGRLEGKAEDDVWIDIPQPSFMTQLHKEEWTDEQKREAQAYEAAHAELLERRDKRRKALDGQLRTLHGQIRDIRRHFDSRLEDLFRQRIEAEQAVAREELAVLKLAKSLQDEQDIVDEAMAIREQLQRHRQQQGPRSHAVQAAQQVVAEINEELGEAQHAEKQLEKSFRSRREFADLDSGTVDLLFRLFKRRPKRGQHRSSLAPLTDADRPQDIEDAVWARVVKLRDEKIESEIRVREKMAELAEAEEYLSRRREQETELVNAIESALYRLTELEQQRAALNVDVEVLITVQNGQVEIQHENDFDPMFHNALLIPRTVVEDLNATTRKLAETMLTRAHLYLCMHSF
ncbi:hypothetical protein PTSG_09206 [Salpingoeca rosetta]|uniref:Cilia- and flagella-associated protein 43 n=1 Tax=Salpingoeca rosetta (strain ATCC 50818 / BSB-021) TaxID=946362 RepID=F2UN09_SALR5|nr:uncharacterized protein PTSG_09206 [Salpingoeca rosetta]EGD78508.1 hypothetical protein PTSG_09206 [Salpingoeca rosetta]|eukprot:XP_004989457.1 hypothetical protein PTSG_09206 [Salpingoeca rosetta]